MSETSASDSNNNNTVVDASEAHLRARYQNALRQFEQREAVCADRLAGRQAEAERSYEFNREAISQLDTEHQTHKTDLLAQVQRAKLDVDAAHQAAREQCSIIGIEYRPGVTTETDIKAVPILHDAEAARLTGLPFGVGFIEPLWAKIVKVLSTIACFGFSTLAIGLLLGSIKAKAPFASIPKLIGPMFAGALVTLCVAQMMYFLWRQFGAAIGSGQSKASVLPKAVLTFLITVLILAGMTFLDQTAILQLSAAKAMLDESLRIEPLHALAMGFVLSGAYVLSSALSAFSSGYTEAAAKTIAGRIKSDKDAKLELIKGQIPVQAALASISQVKVVETRLAALERDLEKLLNDYKAERQRLVQSLPSIPHGFLPEEEKELMELRQHIVVAQANLQAWEASRVGMK